MKKKTTNEILAESFLEIAAQKDADRITIRQIVGNCGMSAPTFYRHFRDKYDLISWIYRQKCAELFQQYSNAPGRQQKIAAAWVRFCEQNKPLLLNLMNNTGGYESFLRSMTMEHVKLIEDDIIASNGVEALTPKIHLIVIMHASGMVRLMFAWLTEKVSATTEEIAEAINESIPKAMMKLITPPPQKKRQSNKSVSLR